MIFPTSLLIKSGTGMEHSSRFKCILRNHIKQGHLNISEDQLAFVTHAGVGQGLLFYGDVILPFEDHFPTDTELYKIMTTKMSEVKANEEGV